MSCCVECICSGILRSVVFCVFFFKQKTAYEMRISDWSSDVCSSDLPNGRIPLLELEDGTFLPESNAILFYLAEGSRYLPDERLARARALQWLFFEQYSHEPYIAVLRFWSRHTDKAPDRKSTRLNSSH